MVLFVNSFFAYEWIGDYPSSCAYYYCSCSTSTFNRPSSTNQQLFYSTMLQDCFDQFKKVIPSLSFKKTKVLSYIAVVCILSALSYRCSAKLCRRRYRTIARSVFVVTRWRWYLWSIVGYFIILLNILCDCNSRGFNSSPSPTSIKVEQIALSHPLPPCAVHYMYNCLAAYYYYASLFQLHYYWITADSQLTSRASSFPYVRTDHDTIIFTSIYFIANRSADSTVARDSIGTPLPWCGHICI